MDPRDELRARAKRAERGNDSYVAIPVELAIVCANLRECGATTDLTGDEDGPLSEPLTIQCRKPANHDYDHYNGSISWTNELERG